MKDLLPLYGDTMVTVKVKFVDNFVTSFVTMSPRKNGFESHFFVDGDTLGDTGDKSY